MTDAETPSRPTDLETRVPSGDSAVECPRCGRPFTDERYRDLHLGIAHVGDLDERERSAYDEAYYAEDEELRRYRLVMVGLLVVLYFGLLMTYALAA